jgi:hypothetical protein
VSLGASERATLVAIIESSDPSVTANERLRAIKLLHAGGGADDDGAMIIARWVTNLPDDVLAHEMVAYAIQPHELPELADREARRRTAATEEGGQDGRDDDPTAPSTTTT